MLILTMTKSTSIKNASALSLRHYSAKPSHHALQKATRRNQAKLVFMGTSPIHTTQGTQPSKEQTNPRPLCDEMGTLNNILSHDSRENVK